MNIANMLEDNARSFPKRKALIFLDKTYSYEKLNSKANQYANLFREIYQIDSGNKIGILLNNCPEYIFSIFGALKTGATIVPINRFLTATEIEYIINDCGISHLISADDFTDYFMHLLDKCKSLKKIVVVEHENHKHNKIDTIEKFVSGFSSENPGLCIDSGSTAVIIYTSGTTGFPKGAMLSHKNILSNAQSCTQVINVTKRDRLLLALPMFHSFTFTVCIMMTLYKGATIVGLPSIKPFSTVLKAIILHRITLFIGIPKIYEILSERTIPFFIRPFIRIRACISGSAPLSLTTLKNFNKNIRIPLLEGYGLSESSPVVSVNPLYGERKAGSVGLPVPGVEVRIVDDNLQPVPIGESGEICVKGDNVMTGYYNHKEQTDEVLNDGWLRTGDIGKIDEDGYVYILDRKKDMILMQGMNIYPREIEEAILAHPAVEEAAVIGVHDNKHGEVPVAFIVKKETAELERKHILHFLRNRIAAYKCPRKIVFIDKLPRSGLGKILKKELLDIIK